MHSCMEWKAVHSQRHARHDDHHTDTSYPVSQPRSVSSISILSMRPPAFSPSPLPPYGVRRPSEEPIGLINLYMLHASRIETILVHHSATSRHSHQWSSRRLTHSRHHRSLLHYRCQCCCYRFHQSHHCLLRCRALEHYSQNHHYSHPFECR